MAKEKKYKIEYLGKTYNTDISEPLTDEEFEQIRKEYYTKPDFEDVSKQLHKLNDGGVKFNYITEYYFKDLMAKVKLYYNNWSIEEALNYKPLMEFFNGKIANNKKVYPDDKSKCHNISTAFRLCGFKTASKPSQFPKKTIDDILKLYNVNDVYYDYSCGWGVRLISSLSRNIEYLGTDPNPKLHSRLLELKNDFETVTGNKTAADIRCLGSEVFVPEWEGKVGLAFSSPPYYCLEDYKLGEQSYKPGTTYEEWKENYLEKTIQNIYKYLVDDGYFAVNVNNFKNYFKGDLVQDTYDLAIKNGFKMVDIMPLKNIKRCSGHIIDDTETYNLMHDNDEKIMIFQKEV